LSVGVSFLILDLLGVAVFAVSGALAAIRARMDVFGVVVLGMTTALGGGVVRDVLLGITPPSTLRQWPYLLVAALVALSAVGGAAAYLAATSRLPFVAGLDRCLPAAFGSIHSRYRTPWVAILVYGLAGIVTAILGQAGTTVRGAYDVLVSMTIVTTFLPFLLLFAALIRLVRRGTITHYPLPGGAPIAVALAVIGFASTALTIVLSTIPSLEEANKPLAVAKVLLSSLAVILTGIAVFSIGRRRKIPDR